MGWPCLFAVSSPTLMQAPWEWCSRLFYLLLSPVCCTVCDMFVYQIKSFRTLATQSWPPFFFLDVLFLFFFFYIFFYFTLKVFFFFFFFFFYCVLLYLDQGFLFCFASQVFGTQWDTQILIEKVKAIPNRISAPPDLFQKFLDHLRVFLLLLFSHFYFLLLKVTCSN